MPSILVVEQEQRYAERINNALSAEGWKVRVVPETAQALQAAASEAPDLVVVSADVNGAESLATSFSRHAGGPGVLGLLPEGAASSGIGVPGADDVLAKPFSDQDLVLAARRGLLARRQAAPAPAPRVEQKLTSHDIFGDVLAEVEGDEAPPPPAAPPPAPPRPAAPRADDDVNKRLEKTLSGMLGPETRPRPAAPAPAPPPSAAPPAPPARPANPLSGADVDDLINKTLSNLELGRTKTGVTRPAVPAAIPVTPPPSAAPPAPPVSAAPPQESTAVRRARTTGEIGLAALEELARPTRRPEPPPAAPTAPIAPPRPAPPAPAAAPPPRPAPPAPAPVPVPMPVAPPAPISVEPPPPAIPVLPVPPALPTLPPLPPLDAAATQRIEVVRPEAFEAAGDQPGERFGQYTLLEKIAVGGMAEVWKARMRGVEGFQKTVAIKKILPHMTDNADFIGMFIDEAKLAAQLSHPNIVHIYDLGKIGRDYYIAMEYVEGKDLRSLLNAGRRKGMPLPLGLALLIGARLASALDYAHRKRDFEGREMGLVHRDVSPQNVLLASEGDVKLCDFGIAKAVSKASQTQMGALKGKLQYMSPEQAWGRAVDARSDIFSLGAVLFEMITGERLFPGDTEISVLESVRQGRTRTPRQVSPSVPREVDDIVARALAADPGDRFANAGEMMQRLEAVLATLAPAPSHSDLAGYMRRVLEVEAAEPAVDEPAEIPAPQAPFPPSAAWVPEPPAAPDFAVEAAPVEAVAPLREVVVEEGGRKSRRLLYAAIAALLVVAVVTWFLLNRRKDATAPPAAGQEAVEAPGTTGPAAALPGTQAPAPAKTALDPAAAQPPPAGNSVDIAGLVDQELAKREAEMRRTLEQKQAALEKQLADAQKNKQAPAPAAVPEAAAPTPTPEPPVPVQSAPDPQPESPKPEPQETREVPPPAPEPARTPEPEPAAPQVQVGDLAQPGPGVVAPQLVSFPKPEYPPVARSLRVEGVVVVSVLVDENGRVQDVRMVTPIQKKVGINEAALSAARDARYKPATKDGVRVKMWTRLKIPFTL